MWLIGVVIRYSTLLGSTWYTEEQGLFWCTFEISWYCQQITYFFVFGMLRIDILLAQVAC